MQYLAALVFAGIVLAIIGETIINTGLVLLTLGSLAALVRLWWAQPCGG